MRFHYFKSLIWIIKLQFKSSPVYFGWGLFESIFNGLKSILQTYALANLISNVSEVAQQKGDENTVYLWLGVLLVVQISESLISQVDILVQRKSGYKIENTIEKLFIEKLYSLNQEQFDNEEFSTKLDRAKRAQYVLARSTDMIYRSLSSFISLFGSIIALFLVSPFAVLIIVLSSIPTAIVNIKTNKQYDDMNNKITTYRRISYGASSLLSNLSKMSEIRLMNGFNKLISIWLKNSKKSQEIAYNTIKDIYKKSFIAELLQPLVAVGVNIYFFKLLASGVFGLDRFIFLRGMVEQSVVSIVAISRQLKLLHADSIEIKNFMEIFNAEPVIPNGSEKPKEPLTIEFRNVSFKYPGKDQLVLDDISFTMEPGSKFALVGENGAGKSTLIKLLLRQYLPSSGNILINGINIKDIDPVYYQTCISNLSQDFMLVDYLTIRENLLIGLSTPVSDREIYNVTDLVGATEFINKLPNQLNNRLDNSFDDGSSLSGGQQQRIAIARSLLSKGYLMLLDEPTSMVDAKAEYNILNNIYKSHEGKTTLIVSHRFSSVRKADTIVVLEQGKIKELGTHEELIKKGGLYKEMFETQAEGYK